LESPYEEVEMSWTDAEAATSKPWGENWKQRLKGVGMQVLRSGLRSMGDAKGLQVTPATPGPIIYAQPRKKALKKVLGGGYGKY